MGNSEPGKFRRETDLKMDRSEEGQLRKVLLPFVQTFELLGRERMPLWRPMVRRRRTDMPTRKEEEGDIRTMKHRSDEGGTIA